jgi:hypothetical protein
VHHLRFDGTPLEFPVPRTPERVDLLVNTSNELHGAESSASSPQVQEADVHASVNAELQRRREAPGATERRLEEYPNLSELRFPGEH